MNGSPVDCQNRTPTEPAGENYFVRPFLSWFALGALDFVCAFLRYPLPGR